MIKSYKFINQLKQFPYIKKIFLFGSRARGDYTDRSDIDIAIECDSSTPNNLQQIFEVIDNADTLLKVDYVLFDQVNKELKEKILKEGIVLYERQD